MDRPPSTAILLEQLYGEICRDPDILFVLPDMKRMAANNSYLNLLYGDFPSSGKQRPRLITSSFLTPALLLQRLAGRRIIVHHHWLECRSPKDVLNILWKLFWATVFRWSGIKLVWTLHNAMPHDAGYRWFNHLARRHWAGLQDRIHVHCQTAIELMATQFNISRERFRVIPHPTYPATPINRSDARRALANHFNLPFFEAETRVVLVFGYIAPYKGIVEIAELFIAQNRTDHLLIAGPLKGGNEALLNRLEALAAASQRVHLLATLIPEAHLGHFFCAADVVVFNYKAILTSGGVILARSYGRPVIAPALGCLKELAGPGVQLFDSPEQLRQLLGSIGVKNG